MVIYSYKYTNTHPHTTLLYSHHMYPGHVISCHVIPYRAIYGRKPHGELICRFLHIIDERNRRIKEQSRDPHYILFYFVQAEEVGGVQDWWIKVRPWRPYRVGRSHWISSLPAFETLVILIWASRRKRRGVTVGSLGRAGVFFFFFFLFFLSLFFFARHR